MSAGVGFLIGFAVSMVVDMIVAARQAMKRNKTHGPLGGAVQYLMRNATVIDADRGEPYHLNETVRALRALGVPERVIARELQEVV